MSEQVFISYNHADDENVLDVQKQLENAGVKVWLDRKIPGGTKWREEIEKEIRNSYALVLIMTDDAIESEYVDYEWKFALGAGLVVLPLYFKTVSHFPFPLADIQYIDFREMQGWGELIGRLNKVRNQSHIKTQPSLVIGRATGLYDNQVRKKDEPHDSWG